MLVTSIFAKTESAAPATIAALNGGAIYVGEAVCIVCHSPQNAQFTHTQHANAFQLNPKNEREKLSCEACHGPGSNHLKDPANPANHVSLVGFTREWGTPVAQQNGMCPTCHQGGQHMFWPGLTHATNELSCSDCHNPMAKVSATGSSGNRASMRPAKAATSSSAPNSPSVPICLFTRAR